MKIAFSGASGTGKTTLARAVAKKLGLPMEEMPTIDGSFVSTSRAVAFMLTGEYVPYKVDDKPGMRPIFQRTVLDFKQEWEQNHFGGFVTDRAHFDNLAYTCMHDANNTGSDRDFLRRIVSAQFQYDIVFFCPYDMFCKVGADPARKDSDAYQENFDAVLWGLYSRYSYEQCIEVPGDVFEDRLQFCLEKIEEVRQVTESMDL